MKTIIIYGAMILGLLSIFALTDSKVNGQVGIPTSPYRQLSPETRATLDREGINNFVIIGTDGNGSVIGNFIATQEDYFGGGDITQEDVIIYDDLVEKLNQAIMKVEELTAKKALMDIVINN